LPSWRSRLVERRSDELLAEAEEAERFRAETLGRQNQSPLEARNEKLERALAYQGAEIAKLKGTQAGLPSLPHVPRAEVPQFLGMPSGLGRHAVVGAPGGSGGVRKIAAGAPSPETAFGVGITRRQPVGRDRLIGSKGVRAVSIGGEAADAGWSASAAPTGGSARSYGIRNAPSLTGPWRGVAGWSG